MPELFIRSPSTHLEYGSIKDGVVETENAGNVNAQRGPRFSTSTARQSGSQVTSNVAPEPSPLPAAVNESLTESPRYTASGILGAPLTAISVAGRRVPSPVVGTFSLDAANGIIDYIISGLQNASSSISGWMYQVYVDSQRGDNGTII